MSSWTALNIEPDEAIEEEVDDTKEIQIEEALKLYQNALKLHSQGPQFYHQAAEAYDELLNSDIFKYSESISAYKRNVQHASDSQLAESAEDTIAAAETIGEHGVNDSTSNTLLQTIYLSYKNHGQYLLDSLHDFLQKARQTPDAVQDPASKIRACSNAALGSFAEALEKDDTDLNLWRKSARLSSSLQSFRMARYCLESVLADDENRLEVRTGQMGLEETLAEECLRETLRSLHDTLSAAQVPVKKPKKSLLKFLKQQTDPYPYLPALPANLEDIDIPKSTSTLVSTYRTIAPASPTWESIGKAINQAIVGSEGDNAQFEAGALVSITLPASRPEVVESGSGELEPHGDEHRDQDRAHLSIEQQDINMEEEEHVDSSAQAESPAPIKQEPDLTAQSSEGQFPADKGPETQLMESLDDQSKPLLESTNHQAENEEELDPNVPVGAGRKRSSASAANDDHVEGVRTKSRRIRARESNADAVLQSDEVAFDQGKYYENRLEPFIYADMELFETAGPLLSRLGVEELGNLEQLRQHVSPGVKDSGDSVSKGESAEAMLCQDLRNILLDWDDDKAKTIQQGDNLSSLYDIQGMSKSGLAAFLEHSKKSTRKLGVDNILPEGEKLSAFVKAVNEGKLHIHDVAFSWLKALIMPDYEQHSQGLDKPLMKSTYTSFQWPEPLKQTIVQLLQQDDEYIYSRMCEQVTSLERQILQGSNSRVNYDLKQICDMEMIQTIFEIHLDVYGAASNPNSDVNEGSKLAQRDRLARWGVLARSSLSHFIDHGEQDDQNHVILRHLWASTFHLNVAGDAEREHVVLCLQDLKRILHSLGDPVINLLNNGMMHELSIGAIDQEISKLQTMDFFMKIFSPDSKDPVDLIESIEPILEPSSVEFDESELSNNHDLAHSALRFKEMSSFLDRGDATLRLFLWRRLQDAYKSIDYFPKVVSCHLRSIEIIMKELHSSSHFEELDGQRQATLIRWLKSLGGILNEVVSLVLRESEKAYESFDMAHLRSSMSAVALLSRLLHTSALYDDSVRVGQLSAPDIRGPLSKSFEAFKEKLREMQVHSWVLQYTLIKEAIAQNLELFSSPSENRIQYLSSLHNALGIRSMCKYSDKQLLKLMKSELFALESYEEHELDIFQILFDLYGIKLSPVDGVVDHGCVPETLDSSTAINMTDFVMKQASKLSIKDLSKSELKSTIEKMQKAIGPAKASPNTTYNRRLLTAFLKSPINPTDFLRAVRGIGELSMLPVPAERAAIAQKGWYFLLGHAALTKFRSQKRLNPVPTTDLDDAILFFRQDLEHGFGRWESWYRLAQTYDTKLEEDITWSADKMNNNQTELVTWQRYAIHCYTMALAAAIRTADPTPESRSLLSDLYNDFGMRMYTSSREPLSMAAFSLADFTRHFNKPESQQLYEGKPFRETNLYFVWNFASYLFRKAVVAKPKNWMNHYMLGKCLWKMFSCDDSIRQDVKRIDVDDVLDSLLNAIDSLPQRRDTRYDPIFEPHFKLVSIVHKLVHRGALTPVEGSKTLLATPWARKVQAPDDLTGWKPYILEVLKNLKHADKSNWHHRMAVRAAHIIYDDQMDATAAAAAKNELTHQIFTKTMTIQVWKPEFERPGRHFVFTTRYVYFFVALLDQLDDRASLDQLLRRVRKKQGDFINHTKLWEDICLTYARVIRRAGNVREGHEEGVFRPIGWEEFAANTARLEKLPQLAPQTMPILELLRDAIELKKLNNHLMKVALLEDLVADVYSRIYELNIPQFVEQVNEENSNKMKVDHLLMTTDGAADTPTPPTSAPTSEVPAPRGRHKGIARRDIQKRAEALVLRRLTSRPIPAKPTTEPTTQPSITSAPSTTVPHTAPETARENAEESISAQQSDIPGSVHDSADDESELSEIDDEKLSKLAAERRALFPNLHESGSGDPGSELSGHVISDGGYVEVEEEGEAEGDTEVAAEGEGEDDEGDGEKEEGADLGGGEDETMGEAGDEEGEGEEAEIEGEREDGAGDGDEDGDRDGVEEEDPGETEIAGEGETEVDNAKEVEDAGDDMETDQPPDQSDLHTTTTEDQPQPVDTQPSET